MNAIHETIFQLCRLVEIVFTFFGGIIIALVMAIPNYIKDYNKKQLKKDTVKAVKQKIKDDGFDLDNFNPQPVKEITKEEVKKIVRRDTGVGSIYCRDSKYRIYREVDIAFFLKKNKIDELVYVAQFFDCDDFQDALAGVMKVVFPGIALSEEIVTFTDKKGAHDLCGFINENEEFKYLEPQTDDRFKKPKNYKPIKSRW